MTLSHLTSSPAAPNVHARALFRLTSPGRAGLGQVLQGEREMLASNLNQSATERGKQHPPANLAAPALLLQDCSAQFCLFRRK